MKRQKLTIGTLSRETGVNIETIRYYEKIGLLAAPERTEGGHRVYDSDGLKQLIFIRRCRGLGFSIEEILSLSDLVTAGTYTCEEVQSKTEVHLSDVRTKIKSLRKMEHALATLVKECEGGKTQDCAIVDTLFELRV